MVKPVRRARAADHNIGPTTTRTALLIDGADRPFRDLVHALLGISSRLSDLREKIGASIGLTGPQYTMLMSLPHLGARDGHVTVGRLAEHLHVSGTYVTAESKKLEKRGELRRVPNPRDRRSVLLQITPQGRRTLAQVLPMVRDVNDSLFASLDRRQFETMRAMMLGLVAACDDALLVAQRHACPRPAANRNTRDN